MATKRGPKPIKIIDTSWSSNLAYAIGLITTDGCLSKDGLLVDLTSKDREQLINFSKCLGVKFKIGVKQSGIKNKCLRVQFKNRYFYDFLLSVGLTPAKSLTIGELKIPDKYFFDYLRGCFDGDGCSYSYWDSRWKSSFMFYVSFTSGSLRFIKWIQKKIGTLIKVQSHIGVSTKGKNKYYQLKYSKHSAIKLVRRFYKGKDKVFLKRKKLKINKCFSTMGIERV